MEEEVYAPIIDSEMTLSSALTQVCAISNSRSLLVKGFRQVSSKIMRTPVEFVLIADDNDKQSTAVINALLVEKGKQEGKKVPVIPIKSRKELGQIVGLVSGSSKTKVCSCGVAALLGYGKNSEGKVFVINALRDLLVKE